MNHQQTEDGLMVPVLPVQQLEDIYDRVVKDEILVRGESSSKDFAVGSLDWMFNIVGCRGLHGQLDCS